MGVTRVGDLKHVEDEILVPRGGIEVTARAATRVSRMFSAMVGPGYRAHATSRIFRRQGREENFIPVGMRVRGVVEREFGATRAETRGCGSAVSVARYR